MSGEPLLMRLYRLPVLYDLARFVSYGGRRTDQMREFLAGHSQKYGDGKAMMALHEMTCEDKETGLTVLTWYAKQLCRCLLGPAPDDPGYEANWQGRTTPDCHRPPPLQPQRGVPKSKRKKAPELPPAEPRPPVAAPATDVPPPAPSEPGISSLGYARSAKEKNKRSLHVMRREARKKLAHHGRRSFAGKEAKKEITAAEAEIANRGYRIPDEGQETASWDRPKQEAT